jgi:hypothetical protein
MIVSPALRQSHAYDAVRAEAEFRGWKLSRRAREAGLETGTAGSHCPTRATDVRGIYKTAVETRPALP